MLALTTDSVQDIRDIKAKTSDVHNILTESQRRDIFQWLQHIDPSKIHSRAQKDYEPGTGEWVSRCPEWTQLLEAKHRCIWLHGIPGAGKTVIMSYLAKQLRKRCKTYGQQKTISVYYYCYFGHNQDEAEPFLKWLISELCRSAKILPAKLRELYSVHKEPTLYKSLNILADTLSEYKTVYITLDAIDESHQREILLQVLQTMSTDFRFSKLHIIASSREYADIEKVMKQFSIPLSMSNDFVEQDIKLYVGSILSKRPEFQKWPTATIEEVKETLSKGAKGMFRWAVCQIDVLRRSKCEPETIRQKLMDLPKTLYETYDRIFSAIPEEEQVFVHHGLQWIIFHNTLYHGQNMSTRIIIYAVEASILEVTGCANNRHYDLNTLQDFCGCLVKVDVDWVEPNGGLDIDNPLDLVHGSLSLAHYTVREYLESLGQSNTGNNHRYDIGKSLDGELRQLVLTISQRSELHDSIDFGNAINSSDPWGLFEHNFRFYCTLTTLRCLRSWTKEVDTETFVANDQIQNPLLQIFHPSSSHFKTMKMAVSLYRDYMVELLYDYLELNIPIWSVDWSPNSVAEVQHMFNLVFVFDQFPDEYAIAFLRGTNFEGFFDTEICFSVDVRSGDQCRIKAKKSFQGTVLEAFSLMSSYLLTFWPLDYLVESGIELSNPSKTLLYYITGRWHEAWGIHGFTHLMTQGANPDLQTYRITPLQVAAARGDHCGIKMLLEAGANPNNYGNPNVKGWEDENILSVFNQLAGHSPLHIVKFLRLDLDNGLWNQPKKWEDSEALLSIHGASVFKINPP